MRHFIMLTKSRTSRWGWWLADGFLKMYIFGYLYLMGRGRPTWMIRSTKWASQLYTLVLCLSLKKTNLELLITFKLTGVGTFFLRMKLPTSMHNCWMSLMIFSTVLVFFQPKLEILLFIFLCVMILQCLPSDITSLFETNLQLVRNSTGLCIYSLVDRLVGPSSVYFSFAAVNSWVCFSPVGSD